MSITKQIQTIRESLDAIEAMLGGVEVVKQNLTTDATIIRRFCDHCGIGTAQDGAGCLNCRALKAIARGAKSPDHQPNSPQIDNAAAGAINRKLVAAEADRASTPTSVQKAAPNDATMSQRHCYIDGVRHDCPMLPLPLRAILRQNPDCYGQETPARRRVF